MPSIWNLTQRLAIASQQFAALLEMRAPEAVVEWTPTEEQRKAYIKLGDSVGQVVSEFLSRETQMLVGEGDVRSVVPAGHLTFLKSAEQRLPALRAALDVLDPDGALLRELLFAETRWQGWVRATFAEGIEQVWQLVERNPHWGDDHVFVPSTAQEILDSDLLRFEPDQWLNRIQELVPVRSARKNFQLPAHVRLRLEEIFRAYAFGMWVSIPGMARSVLEYSIRDNAGRMKIDLLRPPGVDGWRKEKALAELCEEVAAIAPELREGMAQIRELGNTYLHPSRDNREALFLAERDAQDVLPHLVDVTGALYGSGQ